MRLYSLMRKLPILIVVCAGVILAGGADFLNLSQMRELSAQRAIYIGSIRVEGNKKTKERIILQELYFSLGDPYDPTIVEESFHLIQNFDVFESVHFEFYPSAKADFYDLVIRVRDRWTLLPDIAFTRRESKSEIGVKLKDKNFLGNHQTAEVEATRVGAKDFDIDLGWQGEITFEEPRIFGSYYRLKTRVARTRSFTQRFEAGSADPIYEYASRSNVAEIGLGRRLGTRHHLMGAVGYKKSDYDVISGSVNLNAQQLVGVSASYLWDKTNIHPWFVKDGFYFGAEMQVFSHAFGSDASATIGSAKVAYFKKFGRFGDFASRFSAQHILAGYSETFYAAVGGGSSVRGYEDGQFSGREAWFLNAEARFPVGEPFWKERLLFGVAPFIDIGDARFNAIWKPDEWKISAGLGLRLFAQKISDAILRVDAAYAFENRDFKIHIDIGYMF